VSQYRYVLIDEFGGALRRFSSRLEATPYLTDGARLERLKLPPKVDPYTITVQLLQEAPF